jgi:putative ABC transport system permease protein
MVPGVLLLTVRDLVFRRRRFAITIVGTALVFAVALVLTGVANGFHVEANRTVDEIGGDAWIVRHGAVGPFTGFSAQPVSLSTQLEREPGVREAEPLITFRRDFRWRGHVVDSFFIGYRLGRLGQPPLVQGQEPRAPGEAVVDDRAGLRVGEPFSVVGRTFRVVGITSGQTVYTGVPDVYVSLHDSQALAFSGRPSATTFVVRGIPTRLPSGYNAVSNEVASADLLRPVTNGIKTIDQVRLLLWIVAVLIVGAVAYVSALERTRDFAVLKAIGSSNIDLFASIVLQSILIALLAAGLAAIMAPFLGPLFPMPVSIPTSAFLLLPALAAGAGLVASLAGVRRAASVDPALAFGGN